MEADLYELHEKNLPDLDLCIKFAGLLIDMVKRVKANRSDPRKKELQPGHQPSEYFIHTNDLKQFFKHCHEPITIYVPLSVGQPYHEGAYAASQVACLQNLRDGYEYWIQEQLSKEAISPKKITLKWDAVLIDAEVTQALNKIDSIEIDLNIPIGQCNLLLQDESLTAHESEFIEKGRELERTYYQLFSKNEKFEQKDVDILLRMRRSATVRWATLKQHYKDSTVMQIINKLEQAFKLGARAINNRKPGDKKFPTEIEKLYESGTFKNWSSDVKVNDLAYVLIEDVMIHCKILPRTVPGETKTVAMMYPGPLSMLLDTGKNILSCVCRDLGMKDSVSNVSCVYLQAEKVNPREAQQDKLAALFSGKLNGDKSRLLPLQDTSIARIKFINSAVPKDRGDKFVIEAMKATLHDEKKRDAEKQSTFELGPYANFLNNFMDEYKHYDELIVQLCLDAKLSWDPISPIFTIHKFFTSFFNKQSSNPSASQQTMSISGSFFEHNGHHDDSLILKLETLAHRYQDTTSKEKRKLYLIKTACRLICSAVEFQNEEGEEEAQSQTRKRSKSVSLSFFPMNSPAVGDEEEGQEVMVPVVRPASQQLPLLGCFFYIQKIIELLDNDITLLNNFRYYPHPIPVADYHSTASSQYSGSVPLSQSK